MLLIMAQNFRPLLRRNILQTPAGKDDVIDNVIVIATAIGSVTDAAIGSMRPVFHSVIQQIRPEKVDGNAAALRQTLPLFNPAFRYVKGRNLIAVAGKKHRSLSLPAAYVKEPQGPYRRHQLQHLVAPAPDAIAPVILLVPVLFRIQGGLDFLRLIPQKRVNTHPKHRRYYRYQLYVRIPLGVFPL